jgi:ketosteroid isomerase-like protein
MSKLSQPLLPALALLAILAPGDSAAQTGARARAAAPEAQVRAAVRVYDSALRRGDVAAAARFWAEEYTFVNARGELLTRADRIANLRAARTAFDTLAPVPAAESIRAYGPDLAVHTTVLAIRGRYSGRTHAGGYRALVVWARRDGRWQQVASQLTAVATPAGPDAR